jgi:hypothetical protein
LNKINYFIRWTARILAILFAAFISIFALDVLGEDLWYLALLIHLIPTFILIAVIVLSWKYPLTGGLFFLAAGFFYLSQAWGNFQMLTYLIMVGPVWLIGLLFIVEFILSKKLRLK